MSFAETPGLSANPCWDLRQFSGENYLGVKILLIIISQLKEFLAQADFRRKLLRIGKPYGFSKVGRWDFLGRVRILIYIIIISQEF